MLKDETLSDKRKLIFMVYRLFMEYLKNLVDFISYWSYIDFEILYNMMKEPRSINGIY